MTRGKNSTYDETFKGVYFTPLNTKGGSKLRLDAEIYIGDFSD